MRNQTNKQRNNKKTSLKKQKRFTNLNMKYYDAPRLLVRPSFNKAVANSVGFQPVTSTGLLTYITLPIQGGTVSERISDSIWLNEIKFNFFLGMEVTHTTDFVRVIVFQTTGLNPTGIPPAINDILQSSDANSSYIVNGNTSFKVLKDESFAMALNGNSAAIMRKWNIKPAIRNIEFVATTIQTYNGQLWYLVIGTQPSAAANTTFKLDTQLYFSD